MRRQVEESKQIDNQPIPVHQVSTHIADISGDVYNKLARIWFRYAGVEVTQLPEGAAYELHCEVMLQKEYVQARSDYLWDPSIDWKIVVTAVCFEENRAIYRDALALFGSSYYAADLFIKDTFPGFAPMVMGRNNQLWVIYLTANLAGTAASLHPDELESAFGR